MNKSTILTLIDAHLSAEEGAFLLDAMEIGSFTMNELIGKCSNSMPWKDHWLTYSQMLGRVIKKIVCAGQLHDELAARKDHKNDFGYHTYISLLFGCGPITGACSEGDNWVWFLRPEFRIS